MRNIWWKVVINVIILVLLLVIVLNNQLTNRKNIIDITASNFIPFQDGNNLLEINGWGLWNAVLKLSSTKIILNII